MDDRVLELFEDFAVARARGERPDPLPYLERAGDDAGRLAGMIDALVATAPPPAPPGEVVAMMGALVKGEPPLLGARLHRRLGVDAVVGALVAALEIDPARRAKTKRLYQRLEGGLLDARRIDPRLAEGLARILGIDARDVALGPAAGAPGDPQVLYARLVRPDADLALPAPAAADAGDAPDEVDRLFGLA